MNKVIHVTAVSKQLFIHPNVALIESNIIETDNQIENR